MSCRDPSGCLGQDGDDALYAYALTGSAFATVMVLAAPHLEVFMRCILHGKG
jgi:hypothetical protein